MVLFDHGERRSGVPAVLQRLGVAVRPLRLPAGDYVVSDRDALDTAKWIARLYRLEDKPAAEPRGVPRLRRPTGDDLQTAEDMLRSLPGISSVGAGRLLAHFGSLERVFAARREELLQVRGIGPVRARTLDRLYRATARSAAGADVRSLAA